MEKGALVLKQQMLSVCVRGFVSTVKTTVLNVNKELKEEDEARAIVRRGMSGGALHSHEPS